MPMSWRLWVVPTLLAFVLAPAVYADEPPGNAGGPLPAAAEGQGVAFEPGTPAFADVLAKAGTEKKPVFLDFFTDT